MDARSVEGRGRSRGSERRPLPSGSANMRAKRFRFDGTFPVPGAGAESGGLGDRAEAEGSPTDRVGETGGCALVGADANRSALKNRTPAPMPKTTRIGKNQRNDQAPPLFLECSVGGILSPDETQ